MSPATSNSLLAMKGGGNARSSGSSKTLLSMGFSAAVVEAALQQHTNLQDAADWCLQQELANGGKGGGRSGDGRWAWFNRDGETTNAQHKSEAISHSNGDSSPVRRGRPEPIAIPSTLGRRSSTGSIGAVQESQSARAGSEVEAGTVLDSCKESQSARRESEVDAGIVFDSCEGALRSPASPGTRQRRSRSMGAAHFTAQGFLQSPLHGALAAQLSSSPSSSLASAAPGVASFYRRPEGTSISPRARLGVENTKSPPFGRASSWGGTWEDGKRVGGDEDGHGGGGKRAEREGECGGGHNRVPRNTVPSHNRAPPGSPRSESDVEEEEGEEASKRTKESPIPPQALSEPLSPQSPLEPLSPGIGEVREGTCY
jgi:hypothetical protein